MRRADRIYGFPSVLGPRYQEGTSVVYSVSNSMVFELLDVARKILTSSLSDTRALLEELEES